MIDDAQLLWFYYDDGLSDEEKQRISDALKADRLLAARYRALALELDGLQPASDAVASDLDRQRWHALIEDAAAESTRVRRRKRAAQWWIASGALAASLVIALGIGGQLGPSPSTDPIARAPSSVPGAADEGVFRRGLQVHMQSAETQLAGLGDLPASQQTELIAQMVSQNRLFIRVAEESNAPELARLLRAFEPILLRLMETEQAPVDADALLRQLRFEYRTMLTQLTQSTSNQA